MVEALELAFQPDGQRLINITSHWVERGARISSVVCDPTPSDRVQFANDVVQRHLSSLAQFQIADRRPHCVQRSFAHRWRKPAEEVLRARAFDGARPEAITEKVERDRLVICSSSDLI